MTREDNLARFAAALFLVCASMQNFGLFSDAIRTSEDVATLIGNIEAHGTRFEIGILFGAIGDTGLLVSGFLLYLLFAPDAKRVATLNLASAIAGVSLLLAAIARRMDALQLFDDAAGMAGAASTEWYREVMTALNSAQNLTGIAGMPMALWGLTLGWLVYRCGFIPRALGVLLMLGGAFPAFGFFGFLLVPDFQANIFARIVGIPMFFTYVIGEYGSILWLLVKGSQWRFADKRVERT